VSALLLLDGWGAWERPLALWLLLLPLLLLLWLRRPRKPQARATGTLALWREVLSERSQRASGPSRRLPPRILWLLLALVAGTLAVAGPRGRAVAAPELWRFEIDRSPSMFLPVEADAARTRYDAALEACLGWLEERGVAEPARLWRTEGVAELRAAAPPAAWSRAPRAPRPEPSPTLGRPDGPRWNLVTDTEPAGGWPGAGVVASGGAAIPGPVGEVAGRLLLWDGSRVLESDERAERRLRLDPSFPPELAELARIWADERGVAVIPAGAAELELAVRGGEPGAVARGGRDGWTLEVALRAGGRAAEPELRPWLTDSQEGVPLVEAGPGRILLGFDRIVARGGDEGAFALSWSELFDRCLPPPPGVVSLAERRAAGEPALRAPRPSPGGAPRPEPAVPPAAWLGAIAALAALLAFATGRGSRAP